MIFIFQPWLIIKHLILVNQQEHHKQGKDSIYKIINIIINPHVILSLATYRNLLTFIVNPKKTYKNCR